MEKVRASLKVARRRSHGIRLWPQPSQICKFAPEIKRNLFQENTFARRWIISLMENVDLMMSQLQT